MRKQNLKNGMIVEFSNGKKALVLGKKFLYENCGFEIIEKFNDKLQLLDNDEFSIIKVYKVKDSIVSLKDVFDIDNLELLWQREETEDWNQINMWTKVWVKNFEDKIWKHAYFIKIFNDKFFVTFCDKFTFEDEKSIKEYDQCMIFRE